VRIIEQEVNDGFRLLVEKLLLKLLLASRKDRGRIFNETEKKIELRNLITELSADVKKQRNNLLMKLLV